jgi:hypothetical protein
MTSLSSSFTQIPPVIDLDYLETQCCFICLEDFDSGSGSSVVSHAGTIQHLFHETCLKQWANTKASCPLCIERIEKINGVPPITLGLGDLCVLSMLCCGPLALLPTLAACEADARGHSTLAKRLIGTAGLLCSINLVGLLLIRSAN